MPDSFGFSHEVHRGAVYNRCIECDEYPWGVSVSERERQRHHERHERQRRREAERARMANLRLARRAKRTYEKEGG